MKPEFRELKIFDLIILSRDWHPSDHISFCKNHPGRELFSTIQIQTFDPNENPTKYSQTLWTRIKIEFNTRAGRTNLVDLRRARADSTERPRPLAILLRSKVCYPCYSQNIVCKIRSVLNTIPIS